MFSTFYTTSSVELQGLISGSAETKEQAAEGLGELIDVTSEKTLREVVVPITGYDFLIFVKIIIVPWFHPFFKEPHAGFRVKKTGITEIFAAISRVTSCHAEPYLL